MKTLIFVVAALCLAPFTPAQMPLSPSEALTQMYHGYNEAERTVRWVCGAEDDSHCWRDDESIVSVTPLIMAEVNEDGVEKTYVVVSAKPAHARLGYECHSCAPQIGAAVFFWHSDAWHLQSVNAATGQFGSWGEPADIDFICIGPNLHGFMLATYFSGQGYSESSRTLLVPIGDTIKEVWQLQDELDDSGAYDPTDKYATHVLYRSSAGIRFFMNGKQDEESRKHYDIEVISRGSDYSNANDSLKSENWTEVYRFSDGRYKLLSHKVFIEIKRRETRAAHK